jgi:hypothetical protein
MSKDGVADMLFKLATSPNDWQKFCQGKRLEGLDFGEIAKLWKEQKH